MIPVDTTYRECAPPVHLRDIVVCYWHRDGSDRVQPTGPAIMPDGCVDIIWIGEQPPFVAGPMTVAVVSDIAQDLDVLGVRFRPGVAPAMLGIRAREVRDWRISCADLLPASLARAWADVPARATHASRLTALNGVITNRMATTRPPDEMVVQSASWLGNDPGVTLAALVQRTGVSERQIRRRFDEAIGYGPKLLQRILRVQRLLWVASQPGKTPRTLSALALAAGYADQPHMTREVALLTASTPGRLLLSGRAQSAVSDLFKT